MGTRLGGMLLPWLGELLAASVGIAAALMLPVVGFLFVFLLQTAAKARLR